MNELEEQLLREEVGGVEPRLVVRSGTRIDTGRWWRHTPLWLCVMENELLMLAVSRRRYVARASLDACVDSYYCHTTGELVIAPVEEPEFRRFRVTPREALSILNMIK
jgi:hypothetical protein